MKGGERKPRRESRSHMAGDGSHPRGENQGLYTHRMFTTFEEGEAEKEGDGETILRGITDVRGRTSS